MAEATVYKVPDTLVGKTLNDAQKIIGEFNPDALSKALGISQNTPFQAGQTFNSRSVTDPVESQRLARLFGSGVSESQYAQDAATAARNKAIAPAVSSMEASIPEISQKFDVERQRLEGEKQPLKERYQTLLDDLKNKETQSVSTAQTASAREFGKRGVPLSSGAYDQYLGQQVNPIIQNFATLTQQTGQGREDALRNITNLISGLVPQETEQLRGVRNAVGQLQAGAGNSAIEDAFRQLQFEDQQRQQAQQLALQQENQKLSQSQFDFQKEQANKAAQTSLKDQFMSIGEGSSLYNLLTGQNVFTAPKTYKSDGGGSGSLPDLNSIFG